MKIILSLICSLFCSVLYAGPIDWSVAMTSFPSDQSVGDTGQEKTPNGYVDLMSGNLVYDIPEVTLKGERGLNFTLSRSYGKVNNGFRSMGNWELESPRLVMMTGASTKLQGDNGTGICVANGDAKTGNDSYGKPVYDTTIIDNGYKNEIRSSYFELANANYFRKLAFALSIANVSQNNIDTNSATNRLYTAVIYNNIPSNSNKVSIDLKQYSDRLLSLNKDAQIQALITNLIGSHWAYNAAFDQNRITRVDIIYSGLSKTKTIYKGTDSTNVFTGKMISNFNSDLLGESNINLKFYSNPTGSPVVLRDANNNPLNMAGLMTFVNTNAYANTLLALLEKEWDGSRIPINSAFKWSYKEFFSSTSDFGLYSNVDPRQRPISLYLPGQKNITFYPIKSGVSGYPQSAKYISQDNWFISCENGGNDFRVRAPNGTSYLFPIQNRENQTGFPTVFSSQYIAGRVSIYASKVENQFGESYLMNYHKMENTNKTYQGYNNSSKFFLESVKHQLDGRESSINDELVLIYAKLKNGSIVTENKNDFSNVEGDVVLTQIKRFISNKYLVWKAYVYYPGSISNYLNNDTLPGSTNTIGQVQTKQTANVYLRSAGDISGDAITYEYGGPYRIVGNHPKSVNGITSQGYMWFYSDLTGIKYYKSSSNGLVNVKSVGWAYSLVNDSRPGFSENKSFKVNNSNYSGIDINPLQITYRYSRNKDAKEQTTTVTTKDTTTGLTKAYTYVMNAFEGGIAESFLHGLLKRVMIDSRTESYEWVILNLIGQKPKTTNDNYTDNEDVSLVRMSKKTVNHHGSYSTTYKDFDQYGNAQTVESTGLKGTSNLSLPSVSISYFNADANNSAVNDGNLPWITGLPRQKTSGAYTTQTIEYDAQGAITSENKEGRITKFKYETVSFSACLGNLADFAWSKFASCFSGYITGDKHTGLPLELDIGNGKQITQYSGYKKGVPTNIRLANGGQETNTVDDLGNITFHTDADGIRSQKQYDDAGRLIVETPIVGLSYTNINYDGLNIVRTTLNGGNYSKSEKYNGDGLLIFSSENAGNKIVVSSNVYDAFGNITFSANRSFNGTTEGIRTSYDVFDRPLSVNDNGVTINYCYQSCGGRAGAISLTTDAFGTTESDYLAVGDFSANLKTQVSRKGSDGSVFTTSTDYNLGLLKPTLATSGASTQSYSYNTNGTLATERDNSINGQKNYGYDATGRIKTISHQDGSVETIEYYPINDLISSRTWRGVTTYYGYSLAGRLNSSSNANTSQGYGRDGFGRVVSLTQNINSNNANYGYTTTFGYNNLNQVVSIIYPNGKSVNLSDQNAFGEVYSIPNVIQGLNYNAMNQLTSVQANGDVAWTYAYSNSGLPTGVSSTSLNKCVLNIGYGYDALNRINRMSDYCGATYNAVIDRFGTGLMKQVELDQARYQYFYNNDDISSVNITSKSQIVAPASYTYNYVNGTSRLGNVNGSPYNFSYDAIGNVTNDGIRALDYDAYYRISKNGNESYIYNTEGLRVRAVRDDGITDYIYDSAGNLVYDINHQSGYNKAYVYVAGKLVATLERYPDTNSKGFDLMNDFEGAEFGINNLLDSYVDSDDDGLPDYLERFIGSDPNNPDSDGDGYKDGYEYKLLGAKGVLDPLIHPNEPDPDEDMAAWLPAILDMILEDD
ncbi:RHS repeat protein [Acinetobacter bereziniae]|uniref:RHS repeat protein n=1 Tax=Acinetobacter bereziniae TaxID=106648 RepID=UPI00190296FB|nr:RHS repeat protein [Acinetobacter bereziniae]MBJ8442775.1 RHS repeat protein [Acinetobacter bereziniae]